MATKDSVCSIAVAKNNISSQNAFMDNSECGPVRGPGDSHQ